jgi:sulfate permease, SulP family
LFIGIAVSVLLLLYRASRPNVAVLGRAQDIPGLWVDRTRHPESRTEPGVLVVRVESGLFFANSDHVRDRIRSFAAAGTQAVVLDAETTPFVDVTAARMLVDLSRDLSRDGVRLLLALDIGQVRDLLRRAEVADPLGHFYQTVEEAVAAARREIEGGP